MPNDRDKQTNRELQRRMISLSNSVETLRRYLNNLSQISGLSPELVSAVEATSELASLMMAALSVSQYATNRSLWTGASTELDIWKRHWRTAYENLETQSNISVMPELFDDPM